MKKCILLLLLFISLYKANSQIVIEEFVFENGVVENGIYTCNKFDWKINIPEGTTITPEYRIDELEEKGYNALKTELPEGIKVRKNRPHLIGFGFSKYNIFSASCESLVGTKQMTLAEHQQFLADLAKKTYDNIEKIKATFILSSEKIGDHEFYIIETKLFNKTSDDLMLTQILYNTYIGTNLFSVSMSFTNEKHKEILINNFKKSLIK